MKIEKKLSTFVFNFCKFSPKYQNFQTPEYTVGIHIFFCETLTKHMYCATKIPKFSTLTFFT